MLTINAASKVYPEGKIILFDLGDVKKEDIVSGLKDPKGTPLDDITQGLQGIAINEINKEMAADPQNKLSATSKINKALSGIKIWLADTPANVKRFVIDVFKADVTEIQDLEAKLNLKKMQNGLMDDYEQRAAEIAALEKTILFKKTALNERRALVLKRLIIVVKGAAGILGFIKAQDKAFQDSIAHISGGTSLSFQDYIQLTQAAVTVGTVFLEGTAGIFQAVGATAYNLGSFVGQCTTKKCCPSCHEACSRCLLSCGDCVMKVTDTCMTCIQDTFRFCAIKKEKQD